MQRIQELYAEAKARDSLKANRASFQYAQEVVQLAQDIGDTKDVEAAKTFILLLANQLQQNDAQTLLSEALFDLISAAWDCLAVNKDCASPLQHILAHSASTCNPREVVVLILATWDKRRDRSGSCTGRRHSQSIVLTCAIRGNRELSRKITVDDCCFVGLTHSKSGKQ